MRPCDEYLELISAAVDGELSPGGAEELRAHLEQCPRCRELLSDFRALHQRLGALPRAEPPADLAGRVMAAVEQDNVVPLPPKRSAFRWRRWAACAAVAVLALAGAWRMGFGTGGGSSGSAAPAAAEEAALTPAEDRGERAAGSAAEPQANAKAQLQSAQAAPEEPAEDLTAPEAVPAPAALNGDGSAAESFDGGTAEGENDAEAAYGAESDGGGRLTARFATTSQEETVKEAAPEETAAPLTAAEALDRLLEEKGFSGWEARGDTWVSWPRQGEVWDHLVYGGLSENGKYYLFVSYRNVYDSPEDEVPGHNSRNGCYAVAVDGGEIVEETGADFWEKMAE